MKTLLVVITTPLVFTGCELLNNNTVMEYPFSMRPPTIIQDHAGFYQFDLDQNVSGNQLPNRFQPIAETFNPNCQKVR